MSILLRYVIKIHYIYYDHHTSLNAAAKNNSVEVLKYLLSVGADINTRDGFKGTPVISAVRNNAVNTLHLLVEKGADLNIARILYKLVITNNRVFYNLTNFIYP